MSWIFRLLKMEIKRCPICKKIIIGGKYKYARHLRECKRKQRLKERRNKQ